MKIAVIGAGFTGLSAALKLASEKIPVTVFEKKDILGGLSDSFKEPNWMYPIEKHYHHWFENDNFALDLIKNLDLEKNLFFVNSNTSIFYKEKIYPFNSPVDLLNFTPLSFSERIKLGISFAYMKMLNSDQGKSLEKYSANEWLEKYSGQKAFKIIWEPLMRGKFSKFHNQVNMTWFWARIKKRTSKLGYLKGGFQLLLEEMKKKIESMDGKIIFNTEFEYSMANKFDKIIFTGPTPLFLKIFPDTDNKYIDYIKKIPRLHALNLVIISPEKLLENVYWLNINERSYPFIGIIQHTNLIPNNYYHNQEIAYIANYLPDNHPFLNMNIKKLLKIYLPYLKKISPQFDFNNPLVKFRLHMEKYAQPIFGKNHSLHQINMVTSQKKIILANMDFVYPWDRGTNYAIELGYKAAGLALDNI